MPQPAPAPVKAAKGQRRTHLVVKPSKKDLKQDDDMDEGSGPDDSSSDYTTSSGSSGSSSYDSDTSDTSTGSSDSGDSDSDGGVEAVPLAARQARAAGAVKKAAKPKKTAPVPPKGGDAFGEANAMLARLLGKKSEELAGTKSRSKGGAKGASGMGGKATQAPPKQPTPKAAAPKKTDAASQVERLRSGVATKVSRPGVARALLAVRSPSMCLR